MKLPVTNLRGIADSTDLAGPESRTGAAGGSLASATTCSSKHASFLALSLCLARLASPHHQNLTLQLRHRMYDDLFDSLDWMFECSNFAWLKHVKLEQTPTYLPTYLPTHTYLAVVVHHVDVLDSCRL